MHNIFAAADIGSNTVHLLVAKSDGLSLERIDNQSEWLALGEAVARTGKISKEHLAKLIDVIEEFKKIAKLHEAGAPYLFATEAIRATSNGPEVLAKIKEKTGLNVDVISPKREAELSYKGISLDTDLSHNALLFEVGGGSAQVAHSEKGEVRQSISIPVGTGRIIAASDLAQPCNVESLQKAVEFIDNQLKACDFITDDTQAIASGGVARGLLRALHPDGEPKLALFELNYMIQAVQGLPVEKIRPRFNVKQKRAETLLAGALVYKMLLERFGLTEMEISNYGVREGAILEMAAEKILA